MPCELKQYEMREGKRKKKILRLREKHFLCLNGKNEEILGRVVWGYGAFKGVQT